MRGFERTRGEGALSTRARCATCRTRCRSSGEPRTRRSSSPLHGEQARRAAGLDEIHTVPAKHFLQEDQAPAVAERVAALASGADGGLNSG